MGTVQWGGGGIQPTAPLGVIQGLDDVQEGVETIGPASGLGGPSLMHPDILECQRLASSGQLTPAQGAPLQTGYPTLLCMCVLGGVCVPHPRVRPCPHRVLCP